MPEASLCALKYDIEAFIFCATLLDLHEKERLRGIVPECIAVEMSPVQAPDSPLPTKEVIRELNEAQGDSEPCGCALNFAK